MGSLETAAFSRNVVRDLVDVGLSAWREAVRHQRDGAERSASTRFRRRAFASSISRGYGFLGYRNPFSACKGRIGLVKHRDDFEALAFALLPESQRFLDCLFFTLEPAHASNASDSWEREGDDPEFFYQFSPDGYALGINVLLYAMSH